jgi:hypothetical protein
LDLERSQSQLLRLSKPFLELEKVDLSSFVFVIGLEHVDEMLAHLVQVGVHHSGFGQFKPDIVQNLRELSILKAIFVLDVPDDNVDFLESQHVVLAQDQSETSD